MYAHQTPKATSRASRADVSSHTAAGGRAGLRRRAGQLGYEAGKASLKPGAMSSGASSVPDLCAQRAQIDPIMDGWDWSDLIDRVLGTEFNRIAIFQMIGAGFGDLGPGGLDLAGCALQELDGSGCIGEFVTEDQITEERMARFTRNVPVVLVNSVVTALEAEIGAPLVPANRQYVVSRALAELRKEADRVLGTPAPTTTPRISPRQIDLQTGQTYDMDGCPTTD